jgi:hypothetical protein
MSDTLREVQAVFASDAALQDGIAGLTLAGFDRAEISLPASNPRPAEATPEQGAEDPDTREDGAQLRTMRTSMAGAAGALAAAGVTIATGGAAAVALVAAAAVGAGAAGVAHTASRVEDGAQHAAREEQAARGELVLSVLAKDAQRQATAVDALRIAGAVRVEPVTRRDGQILA